jgi:hypothetical protein
MHPALTTLSPAGHYIDWWVIHISVTNLAIILTMIAVFVAALYIPFPHADETAAAQTPPATGDEGDGQ